MKLMTFVPTVLTRARSGTNVMLMVFARDVILHVYCTTLSVCYYNRLMHTK